MNERKRIVDVAASIVKVYQLLQDQKKRRVQIMISLLKEVGRGKRGARDLTYEEALQAAESILTGTATPVQIGLSLQPNGLKWNRLRRSGVYRHLPLAFQAVSRQRKL